MVCAGYTRIWDLDSGELVRLDGARGTTLRVTRGTLWITQERDTRDIVLAAGDVFTIDRGGLTLVQAHGDASVCVLSHYVEAVRIAPERRPLRARRRDFLVSTGTVADVRRWVPHY